MIHCTVIKLTISLCHGLICWSLLWSIDGSLRTQKQSLGWHLAHCKAHV